MTYFLGLVRTTQPHTGGLSWLFITSSSLLSVFLRFRRVVVGSNTAVWGTNKPCGAGCKRQLVSWAVGKFPVCFSLCRYLFGLPSLPSPRCQDRRVRDTGQNRTTCWCFLFVILSVCGCLLEKGGDLSPIHTHTCRADVDCAASGFCGCSCGVEEKKKSLRSWSVLWGVKCEEMLGRGGWERGKKRGGTCETEQPSLPRRQVCVNRGAVTVSDIFVKRRSPHRISSNLLLRAKLWQRVVVTDLTCELSLSDRKLRRQLTHENLSTLAGKHQSVSPPPPFFSWHLRPEKEVFSSFLICTAVNLCYRLLKAKYLLLPHAVYRNSCISNAYGDWDIQFALSNVLISYCCYFGKCE